MLVRRGRPTGHRLSEKSKRKISKSKMGQTHTDETREKISNSVIEYFKTEKGIIQRQVSSEIGSKFWNSYGGKLAKGLMRNGMKKYWEEYKKSMET